MKQSADEKIPEEVLDEPSSPDSKGKSMFGRFRGIKVASGRLNFPVGLTHPILQNGFSDKIPQEHKDRVSDEYDHAKTFLSEEYFPKGRREQFVYRGKKVIIECQKHDDYQASLKWLLDTLETYSVNGKQTVKNAHSHSKDVAGASVLPLSPCPLPLTTFVSRNPPLVRRPGS